MADTDAFDALAQDALEQRKMDRAAAFFEEAAAVNLDEVTSETVRVSIKEFKPDPNHEGRQIATWRVVELDGDVEIHAYNFMMAGREKMVRALKLRAVAEERGGEVSDDDPQVKWMTECVLKVWKQTEPDMTFERLSRGLNYKKVLGLFARFFKDALPSRSTAAVPDGSMRNGSGLLVEATVNHVQPMS